jgi:hypothetical protein
MTPQSSEERSRKAWRLARRRHGVLTRRDLLGLGYSAEAIKHRVRTGRLHPIVRGVYAVGRPCLSREGRWIAAVLACGPGAALSHRSAAALWKFGDEHKDYIDVSVRRASESRLPGVRCHRRPTLPPSAIIVRQNIPLTRPVQTFLDLATVAGPKTLERAINEADKRDVIDPDALRKALDDHAGTSGVRPLRFILDQAHLPALGRRTGTALPPACRRRGPADAARQTRLRRVRGRLLLARAGSRGRDRRLALPPHSRRPDPRRAALSGPHGGRPHSAALLPLAGEARTSLRRRDPQADGREPGGCASPSPCVPATSAPVAWSTAWTTSPGSATPLKTKL